MDYVIEGYLLLNIIVENVTKAERKEFGKWFMENKERRLDMIIDLVKTTEGYEHWQGDFSPESLKLLSSWYEKVIEFRPLSEREKKIQSEVPPLKFDIEPVETILTDLSYAIVCDVGIYFGEVFVRNWPQTYWSQYFPRGKNYMFEGHMVIMGFKFKKVLNPIWVMHIMSGHIKDNTYKHEDMFHLYNVYKENLDFSEK